MLQTLFEYDTLNDYEKEVQKRVRVKVLMLLYTHVIYGLIFVAFN